MARNYNAAERKQKDIEEAAKKQAQPIIDQYTAKIQELDKQGEVLRARKQELDERENTIKEQEKIIEQAKQEACENAIADIKENEAQIRQEEYERIIGDAHSQAEQEANNIKEQIEKERTVLDQEKEAAKVQIEEKLREATEARDIAIHEKEKAIEYNASASAEALEKIDKAQLQLQNIFTEEYTKLVESIETLAKRRAAFDIEEADQRDEREYIQELKAKYENCSPAKIAALEVDLKHAQEIADTYSDIIKKREETIAELQKQIISLGIEDPVGKINRLNKDLNDALEIINNSPSPERITELLSIEREFTELKRKYDEAYEAKTRVESLLATVQTNQRELDNKRMEAEALKALNDQLQEKLRFIADTYNGSRENKFAGLTAIDAAKERYTPPKTNPFSTLKDLVVHVRDYGRSQKENPLFYSEETIRVFIASLAASYSASRLLILQGLSGTGKSSLPNLFAEAINAECDFVSVQPSWRDNRELLGYDNDFTNRFKETEFTKYLYKASSDQQRITLILLDEMNLARIEYYFADFLSELEKRKDQWSIPLISNYTEENDKPQFLDYSAGSASIIIGKNVWFIGTANNDDSTSTITDKVYDRAQILDMDKREDIAILEKDIKPLSLSMTMLSTMFDRAISDKANQLTAEDWVDIDIIDVDHLQQMDITFGSRIKTQLESFVPAYIACGGTREGAIDYYLAHKILRKLDERYDAYIKNELLQLIKYLDSKYGQNQSFVETRKKIGILLRRNFSGDEE